MRGVSCWCWVSGQKEGTEGLKRGARTGIRRGREGVERLRDMRGERVGGEGTWGR